MNEYTLKADNRRPLKFNGELLGVSDSLSDEEIQSSLEDEIDVFNKRSKYHNSEKIRLSLYHTNGGKYILYTERFRLSNNPVLLGFNGVVRSIEIHESMDDYIKSAEKNDGTFGRVTSDLMDNVVSNHPEYSEYWVETID